MMQVLYWTRIYLTQKEKHLSMQIFCKACKGVKMKYQLSFFLAVTVKSFRSKIHWPSSKNMHFANLPCKVGRQASIKQGLKNCRHFKEKFEEGVSVLHHSARKSLCPCNEKISFYCRPKKTLEQSFPFPFCKTTLSTFRLITMALRLTRVHILLLFSVHLDLL